MSRDLARPRDSKILSFYCEENLKVSHHFAKSSDNGHCGNGLITFLIWNVISSHEILQLEAPQCKSAPYQGWWQ